MNRSCNSSNINVDHRYHQDDQDQYYVENNNNNNYDQTLLMDPDEEEELGEDINEKRKRAPVIMCGNNRRGGGGGSSSSCQAESCRADLTGAKRYHRRHKVCEFHAKAPVVLVAGLRQRFCQQCSRYVMMMRRVYMHDTSSMNELINVLLCYVVVVVQVSGSGGF